ncbi:MT-A70 family methyltransferase [Bradyrhizobium yuanmingense]|uniref:MT-A70 family methyltransferase n=1 Tax=Bradyrhizobium yuanmingense TaxID=108015 RepID=UPI0004AC77B4|nr:MT-A70 family methyltransferase [Bradyrhizobium yuanmingense]
MTLLAAYDRIYRDLTKVNNARDVLDQRDYLDHVKLHARKVQDKALLEEAIIAQMRADRRLGEIIVELKKSGKIVEGRRRTDDAADRVTLEDIGVKKRVLSSRAQKAAALSPEAFKEIEETTREKVRSGGAILVDPVSAATKEAEIAGRRAAHAARTEKGGCVADLGALALTGKRFGSIGSDPQWKFLTRSAAGEGRSANIHYKTEEVDKIKDLPVGQLLADDGAFYMWMVDWCPQDALDLLAHWGLKHVTTAFTWVKQNASGEGWHMGQGYWTRANPEQCWLATKGNPKRLYADVRQLIVAPVMEHSRKPDEWLDRIERLTEGDYLELQARRPRKGWVSWGDELEWTGVAA